MIILVHVRVGLSVINLWCVVHLDLVVNGSQPYCDDSVALIVAIGEEASSGALLMYAHVQFLYEAIWK